jgi:hypothetical protein
MKSVLSRVVRAVVVLSLVDVFVSLGAAFLDPSPDRAIDTAVLVAIAVALVAALWARDGLVDWLTAHRWAPPAAVAALGIIELVEGDPADRRLVLSMIGIGISAAMADTKAATVGVALAVGLHVGGVAVGAIHKAPLDVATSAGLIVLFAAGATTAQRWLHRFVVDEQEVEAVLGEADRSRADGARSSWKPRGHLLPPRVATVMSWHERVALLTPAELAAIAAYAQGAHNDSEALRLAGPAGITKPGQVRELLKTARRKLSVETKDGLVAMVENVKFLE